MTYDVKEEFGKFIETMGITNRVLKYFVKKYSFWYTKFNNWIIK